MLIPVQPDLAIDTREIELSFLTSGGPGGQNVNKLASAVQLRFDAARSRSLPEDLRARLSRLAGRKMSQDGVIVITARRHRTQERNRAEALERLLDLLRRAAEQPRPRRRTRPGGAALERRKRDKMRASARKALRRRTEPD